MPTPKRWFPVSRELNDDPEVWALTDAFGDRALRIWLELLSILDRCDNRWRLAGHWLAGLSRKVRQQPATVQRVVDWMLARGWLAVEEVAENGSPLILNSPNFWKYHKRREPSGTTSAPAQGPPIRTIRTTRPTHPTGKNPSAVSIKRVNGEKDRTHDEEVSAFGDLTVRSGDGELTQISIRDQVRKIGEESMKIHEQED